MTVRHRLLPAIVALAAVSGTIALLTSLQRPAAASIAELTPPARFAGTVRLNGQQPPPGTQIEARIGTTVCGETQTFAFGGDTRYVIDVHAAASRPGCGVENATVSFVIGGQRANESAPWRNYTLTVLHLSAGSPAQQPIVEVPPLLPVSSAAPPARFAGTLRVNGERPPAGTVVEARIDGVLCGASASIVHEGEAWYVVSVSADDPLTNPGCGREGAEVQFTVGGIAAAQSGTWRNYALTVLHLTAGTSSQPPGAGPPVAPPMQPGIPGAIELPPTPTPRPSPAPIRIPLLARD